MNHTNCRPAQAGLSLAPVVQRLASHVSNATIPIQLYRMMRPPVAQLGADSSGGPYTAPSLGTLPPLADWYCNFLDNADNSGGLAWHDVGPNNEPLIEIFMDLNPLQHCFRQFHT